MDRDAKRASTRSFLGYLSDRITGSADFEKAPSQSEASAATIGSKNPANDEARKAAGMKNGGVVKSHKPQYR